MPSLPSGAEAAGDSGESHRKGGESEMNRRTHPTSNTQQRISNFLYAEDPISGAIPERFVEFCRHSIEGIRGDLLYTNPVLSPDLAGTEFDGAEATTLELDAFDGERLVPLEPIS